MLTDLKEIKEKQEYIISVLGSANVIGANSSLQHAREEAITCLDMLDAVISRLNSRELEKEVAIAQTYARFIGSAYYESSDAKGKKKIIDDYSTRATRIKEAQAAINTIKGKDND